MCGFCGFVSFSYQKDQNISILKNMNNALNHRGPDDEGYYYENNIFLAHKRLSILDLNKRSSQPFKNKDGNLILLFNGEIYNYLELKKELKDKNYKFNTTSDTEVLLACYEIWDIKMLKKIKGMFSFSIVDLKKKIIFSARDHFGQKPFYYYLDRQNFIFSSELRSLLKNPGISKKLDYDNTISYLHYDAFVGDTTPIQKCKKLLPSEYLIYDINNKTITKNKYWSINYKRIFNDENKINSKIDELLKDSVKQHLRSDVPVAIYLSGGIDSTSLASIAKKELKFNNLTAFNLKFNDPTFDEDEKANFSSNELGIKLIKHSISNNESVKKSLYLINELDEPLSDPGYLAVGMIAEFVKKNNFKVVISGDGGDELFGGYEPFLKLSYYKIVNKFPILKKIINIFNKVSKDSFNYMGFNYKLKVFEKGLLSNDEFFNSRWLSSYLEEDIKNLVVPDIYKRSIFSEKKSIYWFIKKLFFETKVEDDNDKLFLQFQRHYLPNLICSHTDKANMNFSIEARSPFLDKDLFDFVNNVKHELLYKNNKAKKYLRNYLKKNNLKKIYDSKKKGFTVPIAKWLKTSLKSEMLETLNENNVKRLNFINYDYVKKLVEEHITGEQNNYKKIWTLFVLIKWVKNNNIEC
tara:strand:- start:725 stop:2632 length:1908 start_codon:yes stop_codon:yes gene_type:complete